MSNPNTQPVEDVVPTADEEAKFANQPNGGGR